jgi:dTDP-glucose 4,6-dehydratase
MKPERLLITGGAGFVGANFVHYWLERYPDARLVVLDLLTYAGKRANLKEVEGHPGFRFVRGDICDEALTESLLREEAIDTVVHFAAESHVDRSITGPDPFIRTNVLGTHALLKAVTKVWLAVGSERPHRFHHISTDEVYGALSPDDPPFRENSPYAPNSPYSASKAAADHLVRAYHHTYGLQVTTSNCSNNYGPYQFPEKLIPLVVSNIVHGKPLPIYGDGLQVRDWLYVEDHNRAVDLILHGGKVGESYNVGGDNEWANIDLVKLICAQMDELCPELPVRPSAGLIAHVTDRPGHDRRYAIDAGKIRRELGFTPSESFETGIRKTLKWYLANA